MHKIIVIFNQAFLFIRSSSACKNARNCSMLNLCDNTESFFSSISGFFPPDLSYICTFLKLVMLTRKSMNTKKRIFNSSQQPPPFLYLFFIFV